MDINLIRELSQWQGITLCDERLTFFYDETGNCGKFILSEEGVNDPIALKKDFILGGVAYIGDDNPANPDELIKALRLQSDELKIKNIYRSGSFLEAMGSRRACIYIDWLCNSGVFVHYATLNNLYYALVDFVDSLWETQSEFAFSPEWIFQLKSALYEFCREHTEETLELLYKYNYPNIDKNDLQKFGGDFCDFIQTYNDQATNRGFIVESFRQMLKHAYRQGSLSFLHDNEANTLVEEYYGLYQGRCCNFKYSYHWFDEEKVVQSKMEESPMIDNGKPFVNYEFVNSKKNKMVQISDVFVGIMSNLFELLDSITFEEINKLKNEQNKKGIENLKKLSDLIEKSEAFHATMIQNINSIELNQNRMLKLAALVKE